MINNKNNKSNRLGSIAGSIFKTFYQLMNRVNCDRGKRSEITSSFHGEVVSDSNNLKKTDKYDTDFPAILDMEIIRRNALDAIASNERIQAYAQFEIYAKSKETLPDKEIQELIGFAPPRTGYKYERYRFIRYSKIDVMDKNGKLKKQSTWLIEKFNPLAEAKAKKAAREQRKLTEAEYTNFEVLNLDDFEVDEGLENHRNMKKVMAEV